MEVTRETVARMAREVSRLDLSDEDVDRVLPYVRAYLENIQKLEALGLEERDPRDYAFAEDRRMVE
jgi:Asp-tRNA(Asn)/Glu-tRNA(Gln) amidotransferase C subunit